MFRTQGQKKRAKPPSLSAARKIVSNTQEVTTRNELEGKEERKRQTLDCCVVVGHLLGEKVGWYWLSLPLMIAPTAC